MRASAASVVALTALAALSLLSSGGAIDDGTRTESSTYVVSPAHIVVSDPDGAPAGLGLARFDILEGESTVRIVIDDAAAPLQDVRAWAVFSQDAPIVVQVEFCNSLTRAIPPGATLVRVFLDDAVLSAGDSACPGDHGATVGTVTARFS